MVNYRPFKEHCMKLTRRICVVATGLALTMVLGIAHAESAAELDKAATAALNALYKQQPTAKALADKAEAMLVFPKITKAGLMVGGQYGEGVMRKKGKAVAYYDSKAASYGLQAGVQTFSYVMFLMNKSAVDYIDNSEGWEVGVGPSIVLVDEGMAKTMTTSTTKDDIYAFIYGQKGLMAGLGLQGTKITKIKKD
jgi:lipid-binding SYLF domain-containing protein